MLKKLFCLTAVWLTFLPSCLLALTPEESLQKNFPNIKYESFGKSPVEGIYEVVAEGRVAYYSPSAEILIVGDMVSKDAVNITQQRVTEMLQAKMKQLPLEKALKIGSGKSVVIEFTDTDCPYCRQASKFLSSRDDVTRYIFFASLSNDPNIEAKVRYIFCSADRAAAYSEVMAGRLDDMNFKICDSTESAEMFKIHRELARKSGVPATPYFLVNGTVVRGANIPEIQRLLSATKNK